MRAFLRVLFDVETASFGWDLKLWPLGRLYYKRKITSGGIEHRVGLYKLSKGEVAVEWYRSL